MSIVNPSVVSFKLIKSVEKLFPFPCVLHDSNQEIQTQLRFLGFCNPRAKMMKKQNKSTSFFFFMFLLLSSGQDFVFISGYLVSLCM